MLKLSHNPRFKQLENDSLKLKWDAIVTSSSWLADICSNPAEDWDYAPVEATRIGWFHYAHELMSSSPGLREYGKGTRDKPFVVGTLIHHHPLKGTQEAYRAMLQLKQKYGDGLICVGVGEVPKNQFNCPAWLNYMHGLDRENMALCLGRFDIWIGASHTEGLGRMSLEAMSAGAACVLTDTGAEFAKDKENCLLVPVNDSGAMAQAADLLLKDPEFVAKIRVAGWRTAEEHADSTQCIDALEEVIDRICS